MSQIWFGGIGAGGGACGAGEAYPDLAHSVTAQFCPTPHAILPKKLHVVLFLIGIFDKGPR